MTDHLGRPVLAEGMKRQIEAALTLIPAGKRGALIVLADAESKTARAYVAANLDGKGHWKVAAGAGVPWDGRKPEGWVGVMGAW
jgi:hypothetical protein